MNRSVTLRLAAGFTTALALGGSLSAFTAPTVKFSDTKLTNGLRVIISENHAAPVFSVALVYDVGSRDERPGRTGFAHLFEHMMFKGSDNVGPGEHFYTIFSNGGTMNGTTNKERTLYFETMPANQLDAGAVPRSRPHAVARHREGQPRQPAQRGPGRAPARVDNQPYGRADEEIDALAFDNFAYKHSVIGSMADLNAASVEDVTAFFKTYYAPNNAILAIVGDVRRPSASWRAGTSSRFRRSRPRRRSTSRSRRRTASAASRSRIRWRACRASTSAIASRPRLSPDDDTIDVLAEILAGGRSGGFYEHIVRQQQRAVSVGAFAPNSRGPRLFGIEATPTPGTRVEDARAGDLFGDRRRESRADRRTEIEKARNSARRHWAATWRRRCRARSLAEYALFFGDPGRINTRWDRLARFSAADVQRVAEAVPHAGEPQRDLRCRKRRPARQRRCAMNASRSHRAHSSFGSAGAVVRLRRRSRSRRTTQHARRPRVSSARARCLFRTRF